MHFYCPVSGSFFHRSVLSAFCRIVGSLCLSARARWCVGYAVCTFWRSGSRLGYRIMQHVQAATAEAGPTSKFAQVNRVKLHYLDWGGDSSHHTILLCHG